MARVCLKLYISKPENKTEELRFRNAIGYFEERTETIKQDYKKALRV
jgi:hypothetical protein